MMSFGVLFAQYCVDVRVVAAAVVAFFPRGKRLFTVSRIWHALPQPARWGPTAAIPELGSSCLATTKTKPEMIHRNVINHERSSHILRPDIERTSGSLVI